MILYVLSWIELIWSCSLTMEYSYGRIVDKWFLWKETVYTRTKISFLKWSDQMCERWERRREGHSPRYILFTRGRLRHSSTLTIKYGYYTALPHASPNHSALAHLGSLGHLGRDTLIVLKLFLVPPELQFYFFMIKVSGRVSVIWGRGLRTEGTANRGPISVITIKYPNFIFYSLDAVTSQRTSVK